jgi:uncharacterized protein YdbL (DUF1318 family)
VTDPTFTVPAMRGAAGKLRQDAAALVAEAEINARKHVEEARQKAERMVAAAAEIEADADAKLAGQQAGQDTPPAEWPCATCGQPMVATPLGPQHKDPYAPCTPNGQPVATGRRDTGPMPAVTVVDQTEGAEQ